MADMKRERLSVTVPADIIKKVAEEAAKQGRSVSNMTSLLLEQALKNKAA